MTLEELAKKLGYKVHKVDHAESAEAPTTKGIVLTRHDKYHLFKDEEEAILALKSETEGHIRGWQS